MNNDTLTVHMEPPIYDVCFWYCVPGYECETHNNPADFFLDVINGDSIAVSMAKLQTAEGIHLHFTDAFPQCDLASTENNTIG